MLNWLTRRADPVELDALDAYARWAASYAPEAHNALMQMEEQAVRELLAEPAPGRWMDLACGSGRHLKRLAAARPERLVGLDFSRPMLARAATLGQPLIQADLRCLPLVAGCWDLIVCGLAVGHVGDLAGCLAEMARILAPRGVLVYSDFHPFGALLGWKRTFRAADGAAYAARHHIHLYQAHQAACQAAGLSIDAVREPTIDFDHPYRGYPAVLVIRAVKQ